jgi:hypothetical protein
VLYGMLVEVEAPGRARTCCITCNEMRVIVSFPLSDTVRVGVKPTLTLRPEELRLYGAGV